MNSVDYSSLLVNLIASALLVCVVQLCTFALASKLGRHSIMDIVWGVGLGLTALLSLILSGGHGSTSRRILVFVLVAVWGSRLGLHVWLRNRNMGEDPRYAALLRHAKGSKSLFALRYIYFAQGWVMWVISLPVQVVMYSRGGIEPLEELGIAIWIIGFGFEAIGDLQLRAFKADPNNGGRLLDTGLWRYTRHPNYFGDATLWWGIYLTAATSWIGLATVISPLLMTHLLVNRTGKKLLEKTMARSKGEAYQHYLAVTSGFFPRPPRREPSK